MLRAVLGAARTRGWDVEVVLGTDSRGCAWVGELERDGIPVRLFEPEGRRKLGRALASLLAESSDSTILHTHFTAFDVPAALAARRAHAAVVWHLHSPARTDLVGRLRGLAKNGLAARLVDRILCVSPDRAAAAIAQGAPRDRVCFFPNAIDVSAFSPASAAERAAARTALGLPADGYVLLHFGWDWHRKGGDVFLGAVRLLRDSGTDVKAVTVGAGDGARRPAGELGLADAVVVLPAGGRVQSLYAAADVFATPSRAEGMPFAMLEALASGVPVAASDLPGQAAVGTGLGACRLTPLNAEALAEAIAELLGRDAATVERDSGEAAERVRTEYDLGPWAERLLGVYDEVPPATSSR
jgi:glycosyltransferase involved in cell wall biosynthesis